MRKKWQAKTLKYFLHFVEKLLQNGCICLDTRRPYLYNSSGFQAENGLFLTWSYKLGREQRFREVGGAHAVRRALDSASLTCSIGL